MTPQRMRRLLVKIRHRTDEEEQTLTLGGRTARIRRGQAVVYVEMGSGRVEGKPEEDTEDIEALMGERKAVEV